MKVEQLIVVFSLFGVLLSVDFAMADGQKHPGHHRGAVAGDCLKPIQKRGLMGVGFWENTCDYGVHVQWRTDGKRRGCDFSPKNPLPCMTYVPANSKVTATLSDGRIYSMACRAKDFTSDPWPMITKVLPDKRVRFGCYHMGYGPNRKFGNKKETAKAVRATVRGVNRSYEEYLAERQQLRQLARQRRIEQKRELARQRRLERERQLARQRRLRRERREQEEIRQTIEMLGGVLDGINQYKNQRRRMRRNRPSDCQPFVRGGVKYSCGIQ